VFNVRRENSVNLFWRNGPFYRQQASPRKRVTRLRPRDPTSSLLRRR